jgi:hypothetical protein
VTSSPSGPSSNRISQPSIVSMTIGLAFSAGTPEAVDTYFHPIRTQQNCYGDFTTEFADGRRDNLKTLCVLRVLCG